MQRHNYMLISGGLDSSYQLLKLCVEPSNQIQPIFFNYGQKNAQYEKMSVCSVCKFIKENYCSSLGEPIIINSYSSIDEGEPSPTLFPWSAAEPLTGEKLEDTNFISLEIENRNMVIFSLLFSFILSRLRKKKIQSCSVSIYTGFRDDEMHDSSRHFFNLLTAALHLYHSEYSFEVLFIENEKPEIIYKRIHEILGNEQKTFDFTNITTSCYAPITGKRCMQCSKCQTLEGILKKQDQLRDEGLLPPSKG